MPFRRGRSKPATIVAETTDALGQEVPRCGPNIGRLRRELLELAEKQQRTEKELHQMRIRARRIAGDHAEGLVTVGRSLPMLDHDGACRLPVCRFPMALERRPGSMANRHQSGDSIFSLARSLPTTIRQSAADRELPIRGPSGRLPIGPRPIDRPRKLRSTPAAAMI